MSIKPVHSQILSSLVQATVSQTYTRRNPLKDSLVQNPTLKNPDCLSSFFSAIFRFFAQVWSCLTYSKKPDTSHTRKPIQTVHPLPKAEPNCEKLKEIAKSGKEITFYDEKTNALTSFMGNFHPCQITVRDRSRPNTTWVFGCAEAYFQACKHWDNIDIVEQFTKCNGDQAVKLGKRVRLTPAQIVAWDKRKDNAMREVVFQKFNQNKPLLELLLSTSGAKLKEHNPVKGRDTYWSDNNDGSGKNMLGIILEETRAKFKTNYKG